MQPLIDSHLHLSADHPKSIAFLRSISLRINNICVAHPAWRQRDSTLSWRRLAREHPDVFSWVTTFDLPTPDENPKQYAQKVIDQLEEDLNEGAVGCKVWKNIGMELRDRQGQAILVDDPIFEPIFQYLETRDIPLLMHIGEPLACWMPLDYPSPHQAYYRANPKWHMENRKDIPHHSIQIQARDQVVKRHPGLRCIGAHLGSLEYSLEEMADRFERFPHYAIDTSARLSDLARFPTNDLREFLVRYQDRVLFGTDAVCRLPQMDLPEEQRVEYMITYQENIERHRTFFGTDRTISFPLGPAQGVNLPDSVCRKILHDNALRWYPRLDI